MGTKRLVELEKELDKTTGRYRSMFLKYRFAFSRKDEYKDCYFKLKIASEKEKERLEEQKQKDQLNKDLTEKNQEVKNQRRVYGEKMTEVRTRLDEAKAEEKIIKAKLYANEVTANE